MRRWTWRGVHSALAQLNLFVDGGGTDSIKAEVDSINPTLSLDPVSRYSMTAQLVIRLTVAGEVNSWFHTNS